MVFHQLNLIAHCVAGMSVVSMSMAMAIELCGHSPNARHEHEHEKLCGHWPNARHEHDHRND